MPAKLEQLVKK